MTDQQQTIRVAFFDVDGVIANDTHRVHYALTDPPQWAQYFLPEHVAADAVWPEGRAEIAASMRRGEEFGGYLTGRRSGILTKVTQEWMYVHDLPLGDIYGRPVEVKIPLANFKADFLEAFEAEYSGVQVVLYDDDPEVVRLVRERLGREDAAVHCTWHIKQSALVKQAIA